MKRLKNVVLFNPMEPLGLTDDDFDENRILQLWGADLVHPTEDAYSLIAQHLLAFANQQIGKKRTAEAAAEAATAAGQQPTRQLQRRPNRFGVNPGFQEPNR